MRDKRANSTEELLDVIRGNGTPDVPASKARRNRFSLHRKRATAARPRARKAGMPLFRMGAQASIGVDISEDFVDLVKVQQRENRSRILSSERLALDETCRPGSKGFLALLGDLLDRHCGKGRPDIWSLLRTSEVDVTRLKLPRMPVRRLGSAVYWQLQKEKKFDEAEFVLDFRDQGLVQEGGASRHDIIACLAKRSDVDRLSGWFSAVGRPLAGVTVVPTSFQRIYAVGWAPERAIIAANIHIDSNFTCITIFSEGRILFSRTIKFGTNSLAEDLMESWNSRASGDELVMPSDDDFGDFAAVLLSAEDARLCVEQALSGDVDSIVAEDCPPREAVLRSVMHSLERVSRQTERTLDYFTQNFGARADGLHLSGVVFTNPMVEEYFISQLGLAAEKFDPVAQAVGAETTRRSPVQRMGLNETLGVAMASAKNTLNLLVTYKARELAASRKRVMDLVSLGTVALAAVLAGAFLWGDRQLENRKRELQALEAGLRGQVVVDESTLELAAAKTSLRHERVRRVVDRYEPLAVLAEISGMMPEGVRLLRMECALGAAGSKKEEGKEAKATEQAGTGDRKVVLEGVIMGEQREQDTLLARLLANLESSALFKDVSVVSGEAEVFVPEGRVLHFSVEALLVRSRA
jgi:Tfp pilus assembly PilM family ATPase